MRGSMRAHTGFFQGLEVLLEVRPRVEGVSLLGRFALRDEDVPVGGKIIGIARLNGWILILIAGGGKPPRELGIRVWQRARRPGDGTGGVAAEWIEARTTAEGGAEQQ
jgi:hypothetical protein